MTTNHVDVLVIGGGLAGLTAAATARAAGARNTVVLEGHDLGGRARTTTKDGFTFNLGAHALYVGGDAMRTLRRLGIQPKGSPPPLDRYKVLVGGELHKMPSGPASLLSTSALGARSKAALGKLLARLPKLDPAEHATTSVDDWIAGQDLRPDAAAVLRALIRIGTYSPSLDDLSAGAAIAQLQRASKAGVIYVDGGWRQLTDALVAQATEVRRGANVAAISDDGEVRLDDRDGTTITAGAIVLAAGPPSACRALLPTAPDWGDLGEPVTAAALDVAVRGVPSPGYVLGVDDPLYGTTQSPPADQAPKGDSVVSVLRYGATHAADDRAQLQGWLAHVGVRPEAIVHDRFLARMTVVGAQPRAVNGGLAGRPPITATGMASVFLAGDWVGPDGMLADAAFASGHTAGLAAAQRAARGAATTTQATMVS